MKETMDFNKKSFYYLHFMISHSFVGLKNENLIGKI